MKNAYVLPSEHSFFLFTLLLNILNNSLSSFPFTSSPKRTRKLGKHNNASIHHLTLDAHEQVDSTYSMLYIIHICLVESYFLLRTKKRKGTIKVIRNVHKIIKLCICSFFIIKNTVILQVSCLLLFLHHRHLKRHLRLSLSTGLSIQIAVFTST